MVLRSIKNDVLRDAFKRWLKDSPDAHLADFEAGWREALGSLPASINCDCLTCREVNARFADALGRPKDKDG
jgi:hypothetical protein